MAIAPFANSQETNFYNPESFLPKTWYKLDRAIPSVSNIEDMYIRYLSLAYLLDYHPKVDKEESKTLPNVDAETGYNPFSQSKLKERVIYFNLTFTGQKVNQYLFPTLENKFLTESNLRDNNDFAYIMTYFKINTTDKDFYSYGIWFNLHSMEIRISPLADKKYYTLSDRDYNKVRATFEKTINTQLQTIKTFLTNSVLITAYKQEFIDLYGKNWDILLEAKAAARAAEYEKNAQPKMSINAYKKKNQEYANEFKIKLDNWVKSQKYNPIEGIWNRSSVTETNCMGENYAYLDDDVFTTPVGISPAFAFLYNNKNELEIFENKAFNWHKAYITFEGFNKMDATITEDNGNYKLYLKKYNLTFYLKPKPHILDSILPNYYEGKKSLAETQTTIYKQSNRGVAYTQEVQFISPNCEFSNVTFARVFPRYAVGLSAVDLDTERPEYKLNLSISVEEAQNRVKEVQGIRQMERSAFMSLQEGDMICAKEASCNNYNPDDCLRVSAFIEKWNADRSKYQIRIHSVHSGSITYTDPSGVYTELDGVRYHKGEIIWIDPIERRNTIWLTCKNK